MDYNIENKGFVCFVYNLQRRRAFWAALLAVLAVKFILCELFLGGAVADALVVKLRFATFFSSRASGTIGVFSRSQSPSSVLFRLAHIRLPLGIPARYAAALSGILSPF